MLWALVYIIGLIATQYLLGQGTLTLMWAEWIWFVLLVISAWSIAKTFPIKWPASIAHLWTNILVTFVVLAVTMLLGFWSGSAAVLFALFLLLNGAAVFAKGYEVKKGNWVGMGLMMLIFGLVYVSWFSEIPFFAAALVLGIPLLMTSWKMK